jgi:asparagine synthase (glutamine-hydrolysing)
LGSLRGELEKMCTDQIFAARFHLNTAELQKTVKNFLSQKRFVNPHFVWFLYVLYKWGEKS